MSSYNNIPKKYNMPKTSRKKVIKVVYLHLKVLVNII